MTDHQVHFVILSRHPRAADLLRRGLGQCPGVQAYGELFNASEAMRRYASGPGLVPYRLGEDGASYLDRQVFGSASIRDARAVGFILDQGDARVDQRLITAWDYLIGRTDIRVIHLTRTDLLAHLVDTAVEDRVGGWLDRSGQPAAYDVEPFSVSSYSCQEAFDRHVTGQLWVRRAFAAHPLLELEYAADVVGDVHHTLSRSCAFIGVDPSGLGDGIPALQSTIQVAPHEILLNYKELMEHFKHTIYANLFLGDEQGVRS